MSELPINFKGLMAWPYLRTGFRIIKDWEAFLYEHALRAGGRLPQGGVQQVWIRNYANSTRTPAQLNRAGKRAAKAQARRKK